MEVVINKLNHPHTYTRVKPPEKGKRPDPANLEKILFMPGINKLDKDLEKLWPVAKKDSDIALMLEEGTLVEVGKMKDMPKNLKGMDVKMAIEMAESCVDEKLLGEWLDADDRGKVTAAIKKQFKLITDHDARVAKARA